MHSAHKIGSASHSRLAGLLVSRPGYSLWNGEYLQRVWVRLGRPLRPLVLSNDEVRHLQAIAGSRSLPRSIVQRAQIVLASGAGETNRSIAKRMGLTGMTVGSLTAPSSPPIRSLWRRFTTSLAYT